MLVVVNCLTPVTLIVVTEALPRVYVPWLSLTGPIPLSRTNMLLHKLNGRAHVSPVLLLSLRINVRNTWSMELFGGSVGTIHWVFKLRLVQYVSFASPTIWSQLLSESQPINFCDPSIFSWTHEESGELRGKNYRDSDYELLTLRKSHGATPPLVGLIPAVVLLK